MDDLRLETIVREHILKVLKLNKGNKSQTARDLEISLRGLRYKLAKYLGAEKNDCFESRK